MRTLICCCTLAGTSACNNCSKNAGYEFKPPTVVSIPYTVDMEEKRLQEIENAIKRLNERIDEITGEEE